MNELEESRQAIQQAESQMASYNLPDQVTTREELFIVDGKMKQARDAIKLLDKRRKEITRPIDQSKKMIVGLFKPHLDKLKSFVEQAKALNTRYLREEERRNQIAIDEAKKEAEATKAKIKAEATRIAAEAGGQETETSQAIRDMAEGIQPETPVITAVPHMDQRVYSKKKKWVIEVTDFSNIPLDYLMVDLDKLRKLAETQDGKNPPPGINFIEQI